MQDAGQISTDGHGRRLATFTAAVLAVVVLATPTAFGGAGGKNETTPRPTRPSPAGTVMTGFGSARVDEASAVAIQRDGKIVVAGTSSKGDRFDVPRDLALVRYTPDGRLDPSFGSGGKVLTRVGMHYGMAVAVQPDGKIVAGGSTLVRYMPDGRLDTSFGTGGKVSTGFGLAFAIQRDGKIVVAGMRQQAPGRFAVARYTTGGRIDSSFGKNGKAPTPDFGSGSFSDLGAADFATAVTIQGDGRIVAAGGASACGACNLTRFALARYMPDGRLDTSFGKKGAVHSFGGPGGPYAQASAVAIQADGKIVAAGAWGDAAGFALARYGRNGRLDPSFGAGGEVLGDLAQAFAVAIQGDGKIVAAGRSVPVDPTDFALARYTPKGRLDPSFGTGGEALTSFASRGHDIARAVAIQGDGKVIAAGSSGSGDFAVARYRTHGKPDPSFGRGG